MRTKMNANCTKTAIGKSGLASLSTVDGNSCRRLIRGETYPRTGSTAHNRSIIADATTTSVPANPTEQNNVVS
jgi:hypothetical protein